MNCYVFDATSVGNVWGKNFFLQCQFSLSDIGCDMFVVRTCFATQFGGSSRKYDEHMLLVYLEANFFFIKSRWRQIDFDCAKIDTLLLFGGLCAWYL
jgi:hypothetical protein